MFKGSIEYLQVHQTKRLAAYEGYCGDHDCYIVVAPRLDLTTKSMRLQDYCDEYLRAASQDEDARLPIVTEITRSIAANEINLLQLVSFLGEYLTHDDASIRSKAMSLLQRVLTALPQDTLSGQQISVISSFFCDRLTDETCLNETLAALIAVVQMHRFSNEDAETVATHVLDKVAESPSLPQRIKFQIYTVFEKIMAGHRKALHALGDQFISGFSDLMSGEKDPRNLMLAFSIMKVILEEFDIKASVQDLFDVVYCYFPITFRPPPDEPSTITTEDLKTRLRECLCASPDFAPYLLPALVEKLNAIAVSVKKDTLQTLLHCCTKYNAQVLDMYSHDLWHALKYEIIQSEDGLLEEVGLKVLTSITATLAANLSEMPKSSPLARWLQPIVIESLEQLREPELKSAKPCGKILHSIARASVVSLDVVIKAVMPGLIAICQESNSASKSTTLFEVLLNLLQALLRIQTIQPSAKLFVLNSDVVTLRENILAVLYKALVAEDHTDVQLRHVALNCLESIAKLDSFLGDRELRNLTQHLNSIVIDGHIELREAAVQTLITLAHIKVQLILELTIPALLAQLPQEESPRMTEASSEALNAFAKLAVRKDIMDCLIVRLLSRVEATLQIGDGAKAYLLELLETLNKALVHYCNESVPNAAQFYEPLVVKLYRMSFSNRQSIMVAPTTLVKTGEIINKICRHTTLEKQQQIATDLFSLFVHNHGNNMIVHRVQDFPPFAQDRATGQGIDMLWLFVYTFAAFRRDVDLVAVLNVELLSQSINLLQSATNSDHKRLLSILVTLLINKPKSDAEVSSFLSALESELDIKDPKNLDVTVAITRGLILRSHAKFQTYISAMLPLLKSTEHGTTTANKFIDLLAEHLLLSKDNFVYVKRLHKQRFYAYTVPKLLEQLDSSNTATRCHHLTALSIIISHTPQAIFTTNFSSILPVLLQCIQLDNAEVKRLAITTIDSIIFEQKDAVGSHLSTLIPTLLTCIQPSPSTPPRTRIASLHLLGSLVDVMRSDKLQPYKAKVIRSLATALDDQKRLVRKEAVITRQKYFVVL